MLRSEILAASVKPSTKVVLMAMMQHLNCNEKHDRNGQCNPSQKLLARECNMSLSSVRRAFKEAREAGLLIDYKPGPSSANLLFFPSVLAWQTSRGGVTGDPRVVSLLPAQEPVREPVTLATNRRR